MKTRTTRISRRRATSTSPAKRILIPVDFSASTSETISFARLNFASAEITLLHVVELFPIDHFIGLNESGIGLPTLKNDALRQLKTLAAQIENEGGRVKVHLLTGTPWREICQAVAELKADLVVMGSHGRTGIERIYFGSTAEQVVRHASCPVLVARQAKADLRKNTI